MPTPSRLSSLPRVVGPLLPPPWQNSSSCWSAPGRSSSTLAVPFVRWRHLRAVAFVVFVIDRPFLRLPCLSAYFVAGPARHDERRPASGPPPAPLVRDPRTQCSARDVAHAGACTGPHTQAGAWSASSGPTTLCVTQHHHPPRLSVLLTATGRGRRDGRRDGRERGGGGGGRWPSSVGRLWLWLVRFLRSTVGRGRAGFPHSISTALHIRKSGQACSFFPRRHFAASLESFRQSLPLLRT